MTGLQNHPFRVETFFRYSLVITLAYPATEIEPLLPPCLKPDIFCDQWAFAAVAIVDTRHLRPKGFPAFLGNNFLLVGYRIFVRYKTSKGKQLRGLYIIKSATNKKWMERLGRVFTHYNYSTCEICSEHTDRSIRVQSTELGLDISADKQIQDPKLPSHSPFSSWNEARKFAGPLPFTFTFLESEKKVVIVEGVRKNWTPRPVSTTNCQALMPAPLTKLNGVFASSFIVENVPYYWKKGIIDPWSG